jgi:hypothetical protein
VSWRRGRRALTAFRVLLLLLSSSFISAAIASCPLGSCSYESPSLGMSKLKLVSLRSSALMSFSLMLALDVSASAGLSSIILVLVTLLSLVVFGLLSPACVFAAL